MKINDEDKRLLKSLVEHFEQEDRAVRERQLRTWRRLKLFWDGFQRVWYSETAHDWRIWDEQRVDVTDQSFYEKPVNVFRAYLESIIAALSTTVPPIKCYPDDADNPLDLLTAKAGDKIGQLIYRHNNVPLLWLHALFTYCTEGMLACYAYPKEDEKFGTYDVENYADETEMHQTETCPLCGTQISDVVLIDREKDEFQPDDDDAKLHYEIGQGKDLCPNCMQMMDPEMKTQPLVVTRLTGVTTKAKTRQCLEVYGGLYVKVANYAKFQSDTPYLFFRYETHYANARKKYPNIYSKIGPGSGSGYEPYERWARLSPQYYSEYPMNNVTINLRWFRPAAFMALKDEVDADRLLKKFPDGCKLACVNDEIAEAENESLDDCWTLSYNPLSDYLYFDPLGVMLTPIQEVTNDLVSLTIQTAEHGIPQTFVDPNVVNFEAYRQVETTPGIIFPASPKSGKPLADSFYEVKTATLSGEIMPFMQQIQTYGQLVSGALPSLFGGQLQDNKTASAYSMSRTQALQRLQNTWKMLTLWWEQIFAKVIPAFIETVQSDERFVEKSDTGDFINVFITKAELEGKIGNIEIEANENLPITWAQFRDQMMNLMQSNNPQILQMLASPENLPLIYEALGLTDFSVPGEDSRNKQYEEIKQLLSSEPLTVPPGPMETQVALSQGQQPETQEYTSVEVDPLMDNHSIEFETCKIWASSPAGQLAKVQNAVGYKNVLLHAKEHFQYMQQAAMPPPAVGNGVGAPPPNTAAPIQGDSNVNSES